jgi:hypothetical protein
MTVAEAKAMPIGQKFQVMQAIWEDMRERFDAMPISEDVKSMLDERRARVASGQAVLLPWDKVESALGRG